MPNRDRVRFPDKMYQPDALDNRITRELGTPRALQRWNVRESYASIAERIGVDEETVRNRIKRAEQAGVIQGWRILVHPRLLGYVDAYVELEVDDSQKKVEIISQLKLLDGVIVITDFEGSGLFLVFDAEPGDALERKVQLIKTMCGAKEAVTWNSILPPCDLKPSPTDWSIIWAMRDDPRKSISEIAKEAKVTTRTVNRRLTLLTDRKALFIMGLPNFKQIAGLTGNFLITCSSGLESSVSKKIGSRLNTIAFEAVYASGMMYNIFFHNLSESQQARDWIEKIEGVASVRMRIMKEVILVRAWLDDEMKKRLTPNV